MDTQSLEGRSQKRAAAARFASKTVVPLVLVALVIVGCAAPTVEVTAIANEGFLIRSAGPTVLASSSLRKVWISPLCTTGSCSTMGEKW